MKFILLPIFLLLSFHCNADKAPIPGRTDERIKQVTYNPRDVVTVTANYGISTMIEFADYEKVEQVSLGDTLAWSVLDVKNRIFIKPVEDMADTNMLVVTNSRVYNFALKASEAPKTIARSTDKLTFTVRFRYVEDEINAEQQKKKEAMPFASEVTQNHTFKANEINMEYTFRGNKDIAPRRVFDDGKFTYFQFNNVGPEPAIFASDVNSDEEAVVNYHQKGKYIVIERLARKFVLRDGDSVTCIYNENYPLDYKQQIHITEDSIFRSPATPTPEYSTENYNEVEEPIKPKQEFKIKPALPNRPVFIQAPKEIPPTESKEIKRSIPGPAKATIVQKPAHSDDKVEWYKYD